MNLTHHRWFSFLEFFCAAISCLALSLNPAWGWWPLAVAGLPWIGRIFRKGATIKKTAFDLLILIFLLSALVGLWAAYDQERAVHKFYLLIGAVILFYALANQPVANIWIITIGLGLWGVLTNLIFLLITDWTIFTADMGSIDRAGQWWMEIRPEFGFLAALDIQTFHPNMVGGINAILIPLGATTLIHFWRKKNTYLIVFSGFLLLGLGLGLVFSSSRAAWGAALIGLGALAALDQTKIRRLLTRKAVLILLPVLIMLAGVVAPVILAESFLGSDSPLTNVTSFASRITIARDTLFLIGDFPFTGGGLGAFPGLYAEYLLVIPFFMFSYSHNLILDLALEQGIAGSLVWAGIILISAIMLKSAIKTRAQKPSQRFFAAAVYASLIVLLIHGMADDPLYSNVWGLPGLLLLPGLAVAVSAQGAGFAIPRKYWRAGAVMLVIALGVGGLFAKPILAAGYANIGAVKMAQNTLVNWPTGVWATTAIPDPGRQAETHFVNAAALHPANRAANHRLGLLSMAAWDFETASHYLESAYLAAPGHRGIRKSLGYCYTWLGEFEKARSILAQTPEAAAEINAYIGWWQAQGRDDLAANAAQMAQQLSPD